MLKLPPPGPAVSVAVLGGGLMGHALAAVFLDAGLNTVVVESLPAVSETLHDRITATLQAWRGNGVGIERLSLATTIESLPTRVDWVIEAVTEDLALKQALFAKLDADLPHAAFASNSSVFRVADLAAKMAHPERLVGTHWWNPPHLMPIVELVHGKNAPPELIAWTSSMLRFCGKTPVDVHMDTPGFIGNRLQHALWREAFALVEEGVADAETVDLVARNTIGMKLAVLGPLENADYIGLDLTAAIHDYVFPALSTRTSASPLITAALSSGNAGAKSGQGLLRWQAGRREEVATKLARNLHRTIQD